MRDKIVRFWPIFKQLKSNNPLNYNTEDTEGLKKNIYFYNPSYIFTRNISNQVDI